MKKKELESQEQGLTDNEMNKYLKELVNTVYWKAIQRYNYSLLYSADSTLRTLDPFRDPTSIARTQGKISGLSFLENYINELSSRNKIEPDGEVSVKY